MLAVVLTPRRQLAEQCEGFFDDHSRVAARSQHQKCEVVIRLDELLPGLVVFGLCGDNRLEQTDRLFIACQRSLGIADIGVVHLALNVAHF